MNVSRVVIVGILVATLFLQYHSANALTKDEAASQYAQREKAKVVQSGTDVELFSPILNIVTLDISRTCKMLNSSKCPKLNDLIPFDTTNQKQIGKFVDGKRLDSKIKNPSIYFSKNNTFTVCVSCPFDIYKYSKHITVDLPFIYKQNSDKIIINNTRYEYHNRYEINCVDIRVAWLPHLAVNKTTIDLVADTINYIKSGCVDTMYNEKVSIFIPLVKHDITTTKQWKYDQWLKEAKKLATHNCLKSTVC